jgi:hypothetical protein
MGKKSKKMDFIQNPEEKSGLSGGSTSASKRGP